MKHTPGPWIWHWATDANGNADGRVGTDPKENHLMGMSWCVAVSPRYQTQQQWESDARLIAAAPEMLAELQRLYAQYGHQTTNDVIAKATGG